jgi:mannose-6-phosphate isomerase-like protein (cupin superfamily)
MDLESIRRIVTGHDDQGKTIALIDAPVLPKQRSPGGNAISMLWVTEETPADLTVASDRADAPVGVPPPSNGSIFRIVDFPPASTSGGPSGHVDHNKILTEMGIDPATQGYLRHANTHRTRSVDYAIVLDGEIDMLMDDSEVHMKAGDVLVQQGTNHAWVNNGDRPCRIAFILIDAKAPPAWREGWKK